MSVMLYPCIVCVSLLMYRFLLCVFDMYGLPKNVRVVAVIPVYI